MWAEEPAADWDTEYAPTIIMRSTDPSMIEFLFQWDFLTQEVCCGGEWALPFPCFVLRPPKGLRSLLTFPGSKDFLEPLCIDLGRG
jgi:hypothetical protein